MITNDRQLTGVLIVAISNALDYTIDRAYKALQQSIDTVVYGGYAPQDYTRSLALRTNWEKTKAQYAGALANVFLYYAPENFGGVPSKWQHASGQVNRYGERVEDVLIDMLASGYGAFNTKTGKQIPSRDVWTHFIAKADKNVGRWFAAGLRKQGLIVYGL